MDVGGLSLSSDALTIEILGQTENYPSENLNTLLADLLNAGVPQETAEDFVAVVQEAMGTIDAIETLALRIYNTFNTADFSAMENLVNVDLTSGMATSLDNGTPVNIGEIVHVTGTGYADKIKGNASDNIIHGGGGDDWISGSSGADELFGGGADDFIFFDAEDTAVYGGSGRDVAVALGQTGVTVNMAAQDLEVVIGGDGADVISFKAAGPEVHDQRVTDVLRIEELTSPTCALPVRATPGTRSRSHPGPEMRWHKPDLGSHRCLEIRNHPTSRSVHRGSGPQLLAA